MWSDEDDHVLRPPIELFDDSDHDANKLSMYQATASNKGEESFNIKCRTVNSLYQVIAMPVCHPPCAWGWLSVQASPTMRNL